MYAVKMFCYFLLICVCAFSASAHQGRIVNGTDAKLGEIPYIVSLKFNGRHNCGASILDSTHILTGAHCVYGRDSRPDVFSVQYGLIKINPSSENAIKAVRIAIHPEYIHENNYPNDIAVITLETPIPLGDNTEPAILPSPNEGTPANKNAVLAGWGYKQTVGGPVADLQRVDIKVYSDNECSEIYKDIVSSEYHLCAGIPEGGKGQCTGDSGGPLVVDNVQVGVVSWSPKPCASPGYPGVFTKVANYVGWIAEEIQKDF